MPMSSPKITTMFGLFGVFGLLGVLGLSFFGIPTSLQV
jgi:hypothetical protein